MDDLEDYGMDDGEQVTESYLRQFGAAWDDPDEAAKEMEDGIY